MNSEATVSITTLKGVGPKLAERLAQLHILTVHDLLFHLPFRYEDRTKIYSIASVSADDHVLIEGKILSTQIIGAKQVLRCVIADESGATIDLVFFYFTKMHENRLKNSRERLRCFGEVRRGFSGQLEMVHPEYAFAKFVTDNSALQLSPCLSPVYSTTKGVAQITWRKLMRQALALLQKNTFLPELLPDAIRQQFQLMSLNDALSAVHFPTVDMNQDELLQGRHPVQQRLIFEELLAHQTSLQELRQCAKNKISIALPRSQQMEKFFLAQLPFQLTNAQVRVANEICEDLLCATPMLRLVQGDVGSGKTVVACVAALQAIEVGYQVALMAPTEILSEQHFRNFLKWLSPFNISVELLTGQLSASQQQGIKSRLESGDIQLIIGTHALFQNTVQFKNLALFIVDEQHRFGVHQRLALIEKGSKAGYFPHQLIMTATPIPRTLAMTAYADLDLSLIDELPPGRKPIATALICSSRRDEIIARVRVNCASKKQAYWICTLIDESDALQCQAAETTAQYLQQSLHQLRVGLVHGRLKSEEKNAVMTAFSQGEIDLLVATTVVEVGVDVPNASLMIIENPERLGLAQLHQLRGRIGRGSDASFCVLLYQNPLSSLAKKRLSVMRETQDGFVIAEQDLQMRGPGDVLGARQSGLMQLRVADLMRDQHLLPAVQIVSQELAQHYPDIISLLAQRWIGSEIKYLQA